MFGNRRRKVNPSQAPRDQFGRKMFHGAFTGGFSAGNQNTVADESGFTSKPFFSSSTRKTENIPVQKKEDFMDHQDFDDLGTSQIQLKERKLYVGPSGPLHYSQEEVRILQAFGFEMSDISQNRNTVQHFSHESQPDDTSTISNDWIIVPPIQIDFYPIPPIPENYKFEPPKLPILDDFTDDRNSAPIENFNLATMFHVEGVKEASQQMYGNFEKRVVTRWEPANILRGRFSMGAYGKPSKNSEFA